MTDTSPTKAEIDAWVRSLDDRGRELLQDMYDCAFMAGAEEMGKAIKQVMDKLGIELPIHVVAVPTGGNPNVH